MSYLHEKKKNLYSYLQTSKKKKLYFQEFDLHNKKIRVLYISDLFFLKKASYLASRLFGVNITLARSHKTEKPFL